MSIVIDRKPEAKKAEAAPSLDLYVVWFDVNCGCGEPDWWWEVPGPQPLKQALCLSNDMRSKGWITRIEPEGSNPRPDGRWDNPC